ncbi:hypothetical protein A2619_05835 [candidate division WWE3 bacterium RIFOXYD1_FULL_39_9]|uniref:Phage virion morphogenesis protein n=1 Tax=candidate division WWE3 bacterium RIFOXYD1_FULL_39_9 TaxID=1802649 RepID=A0A1F4X3P2_UNCKA|nr:MAG: hypothetical protein A2619_05835 [candidate division WWE3 bacterium RIFOXYD1_FULL_39_9]
MPKYISVKVEPDDKIISIKLNKFNQKALDAVHYRLVWGANRIRNRMINLMRHTPKTGKKYRRGKKWHIASSPGNAPAVDRGQLIRSIVMDEGIDYVEVGVKSGAPYAAALEEGTSKAGRGRKTKILPRPFLKPSVAAEMPRIESRIYYDLNRLGL